MRKFILIMAIAIIGMGTSKAQSSQAPQEVDSAQILVNAHKAKTAPKAPTARKGIYVGDMIKKTVTIVKSDSAEFAGIVPSNFQLIMKPR